MKMKSVSDCFNFIDSMMLCIIEKHVGFGNLGDFRDFMIEMYNEKYNEETVAMLAILSQINLVIENYYFDNQSNTKK